MAPSSGPWPFVGLAMAAAASMAVAGRWRGSGVLALVLAVATAASRAGTVGSGAILSGILVGSALLQVAGGPADLTRRGRASGVVAAVVLTTLPVDGWTLSVASATAGAGTLLVAVTWLALLPWLGAASTVALLGTLAVVAPAGHLVVAGLRLPPVSATHPSGAVLDVPQLALAEMASWWPTLDVAVTVIASATMLAAPWLSRQRHRIMAACVLTGLALLALPHWRDALSTPHGGPSLQRLAWGAFRLLGWAALLTQMANPAAAPELPDSSPRHSLYAHLTAVAFAAVLGVAWAAAAPGVVGPTWAHDPAAFALAATALASAAALAARKPSLSAAAAAAAWYAAVTLAGGAGAGVRVPGALD